MKRVFVKGKLPSCKFTLRKLLPEIALFTLSFVRCKIPSFFYLTGRHIWLICLVDDQSMVQNWENMISMWLQIRIVKWAVCCFFLIVKACNCSSSNKQLQTRSCSELVHELMTKFKIVWWSQIQAGRRPAICTKIARASNHASGWTCCKSKVARYNESMICIQAIADVT